MVRETIRDRGGQHGYQYTAEWYTTEVREGFSDGRATYLIKKIQRQVIPFVIPPPITGPRSMASPKKTDTLLMYVAYNSGGTRSKNVVIVIEYIPEPPTP